PWRVALQRGRSVAGCGCDWSGSTARRGRRRTWHIVAARGADGMIRQGPLFVVVASRGLLPGLAIDAIRLLRGGSSFGAAICIGRAAAARCDASLLRPLASITIRGNGNPVTVYEPWSGDAAPVWREAYALLTPRSTAIGNALPRCSKSLPSIVRPTV